MALDGITRQISFHEAIRKRVFIFQKASPNNCNGGKALKMTWYNLAPLSAQAVRSNYVLVFLTC